MTQHRCTFRNIKCFEKVCALTCTLLFEIYIQSDIILIDIILYYYNDALGIMLRNCIIQFDSFSEILAFKLFVRMRNLTQVALIIKQQQGAVHGALKCEKCTSALS